MPLWGRQPGGSSRRREKERLAWEREASLADIYHDPRVEELGSSDDSDTQVGVGLNFAKKRFVSDPLQFTGIDMGAKPRARRSYVYQESASAASSNSDSEDSEVSERQIALRNKEEALVQSALARMRRAYERGKTEVKLDPEELEALERRKQKMQAKKASEERRSSKVTVALAPPPEIFNTRRRKHTQRDELAQPPGMLVAGPDGNLIYAPFGQHPPQALSSPRNATGGSSRPRSATNQSRNSNPPPSYYPQSPNGRHISDPQTTTQTTALSHPSSSPRLRDRDPLPHEEGWTRINSSPSRQSSVSSVASSSRHSQRTKAGGSPLVDPFAYQVDDEAEENDSPPIPGQFIQSSTPSRLPRDVIYSSVRRTIPSPYQTTSHTAGVPASISDPTLSSLKQRTNSRTQHQEAGSAKKYQDSTSSSSESSGEDELAQAYGHGVKVHVDESSAMGQRGSGSGVARKPVGSGNGGSVKARKGRRGR